MELRKATIMERIKHHLGNTFSPVLRRENRMMVERTIKETWRRVRTGQKPRIPTIAEMDKIFHDIQTELGVLPKMSPSEVWDAVDRLERSWHYDADGNCWIIISPKALEGWRIVSEEVHKPGVLRFFVVKDCENHAECRGAFWRYRYDNVAKDDPVW